MKKKFIITILVFFVLVGLGFLIFDKLIFSTISDEIENIENIKEMEEKKVDKTFVPILNDNLTLNVERNLSENDLVFLEKRINEYEARVTEFNDETSLIDKVNVYFMLSADYRTLGEYGKAKELLEKALTLDSKNSNLMQVYSSLLSLMGDKDSALLYINKALALYDRESNYWLWKIELEKDRGINNKELEVIYKNALESTGSDLNIVTVYAQFLEEKGNFRDAKEQWEKAIAIFPQNKNLYQQEIVRLESEILNAN